MPDPQNPDLLARLADPTQASVFDSTAQQVLRRLAQALQNGELARVAMGATAPVKGGQAELMRRIPVGGVKAPVQVADDLAGYGYSDLAEGVWDAITGGRRSQITMPGMQRLVKGFGYDEGTRQMAQDAANNPEYLQKLLDFVLWRHGPGR